MPGVGGLLPLRQHESAIHLAKVESEQESEGTAHTIVHPKSYTKIQMNRVQSLNVVFKMPRYDRDHKTQNQENHSLNTKRHSTDVNIDE